MQVSPTEIEETLRQHPEGLVIDVSVAGVSGGRTADERVPRAWVVLSPKGKALGATEVIARLNAWIRETLSQYKWLRGGIGIVDEVSSIYRSTLTASTNARCRYLNRPRARCCAACWWTHTKPRCRELLSSDSDEFGIFFVVCKDTN